jgi:hypothetical protein
MRDIIEATWDEHENWGYLEVLDIDQVYQVTNLRGGLVYAISLDGRGSFFYDTLEDLEAEHG